MCGIAGILSGTAINTSELEKMTEVIRHRGPNDVGFALFDGEISTSYCGNDTPQNVRDSSLKYTSEINLSEVETNTASIGFGHRRLSILDLTENGHQPMSEESGDFWICYNGEVYNYKDVRDELISLGYIFNTNTDTEVILLAFKEWGLECMDRFVGMFAIAIYDKKNSTVNLIRDRFGIKPLYYWISPSGNFYFASEIKQFTVLNEWRAILNHQRAYDYLVYSFTDHTEETMFKGVYQVKPGHNLSLNLNNRAWESAKHLKTTEWYKPKKELFTGSYEEAVQTFRKKLEGAIKLHMVSDVSVGAALSGGLDSSSIVCVIDQLKAGELKNGGLDTFSAVSKYEKYSEKKWVDEVRNFTSVSSHFIYSEVDKVFTGLESLIWHMDEPYQSQRVGLLDLVYILQNLFF